MSEQLHETLTKIKSASDIIDMQAKRALGILNDLDLPVGNRDICPRCGSGFRGPLLLAEHLYVSHDGPVPEHWLAIEARSLEPTGGEG